MEGYEDTGCPIHGRDAMGDNSGAIGALICVLVAMVAIATVVGAVILRAAVSLFNKLAGGANSPHRVPEPNFGKAMLITFVTILANQSIGIGLLLATGLGALAMGANVRSAWIATQLISTPVGMLVMSAMLARMLPTTFPRAILVMLCIVLVWIFVAAAVGAIVFGVYMATRVA
jgi:hypothetical protein